MMGALAAMLAALGAVSTEGQPVVMQEIALAHRQAYVFSAPVSTDGDPRLFILDGRDLHMYADDPTAVPTTIKLPRDAAAVDLYDTDGDGVSEILVVAGSTLLIRPLVGDATNWEPVFERTSLYSDTAAFPFPQVLAVEYDDETTIALPQISGFELWSLDGKLREHVDYGMLSAETSVPALPFDVSPVVEDAAGRDNAMVHRIVSRRDPGPMRGEHSGFDVRVTPAVRSDVSDLPSDQWPAFPLRMDSADVEVLHAPVPPKFDDTYIRLRSTVSLTEGTPAVGPPRRYPGRIVLGGNRLPDFNRDGFVDLVLWKAAVPGIAFDTIVSAIRDDTWPLTIAVHLFNPRTRLYEAEPFALIRTKLPLSWYENARAGGPIRDLLLDDVDGDGFLDVGFATGPNSYSIWTYSLGFDRRPAYVIRASEGIEGVVRDVPLGAPASRQLLLRGPNTLYVVHFQ